MCIIHFVSNYKQELIKKFDVLFTLSLIIYFVLRLFLFIIVIEEEVKRVS